MDRIIISELHRSLILLGADSSLLEIVKSWKSSLPDDMVLSSIQHWNAVAHEKLQQRLEAYQAGSDKKM
jgi:hypothetical protein